MTDVGTGLGLSNEWRLLLAGARTTWAPGDIERVIQCARQPLDWNAFADLAEAHGVNPLVHESFQAAGEALAPPHTMQRIHSRYMANVYRSLRMVAELSRILSTCEKHDILAVPFKGPVLAAFIYGNASLRESVDLDLLIHPQQLDRAAELLEERGYERTSSDDHEANEIVLRHRETQSMIELHPLVVAHWQLRGSFALTFEDVRPRLIDAALAGTRHVKTLSPDDLLLVLSVHGSCHHWSRLAWIVDIAECLRTMQEAEVSAALARARALGAERMVLLALRLAHELLEAELPADIRTLVYESSVVRRLATQVYGWLMANEGSIGLLDEALFFIGARERLRDKLPLYPLFLRASIIALIRPTAKDQEFIPLPAKLRFLHYATRPFRLAVQGLSGVARLALKVK